MKTELAAEQKKPVSELTSGEVLWLHLDLTNPNDARKAAEDFLGMEQRLDILGESFAGSEKNITLRPRSQ